MINLVRKVYADNAATTAVSKTALEAMLPCLEDNYGNPSSIYRIGAAANKTLEQAREEIASILGGTSKELYFTSGASESNNWAIKGYAHTMKKKGKNHIITTAFEHHAVLHPVQTLEKEGFEVTYLDVHEDGIVRPEELKAAIKDTTGLVTIIFANNEIGTIQPIKEIGEICREAGIVFHTDAVQAVGNVAIDVKDLKIDMLSLTAHKFHGPKGVGALYIRKGIMPKTLIEGGAQERGRRAGTENVASVVGMAAALKEAVASMEERTKKLTEMRNRLIDGLLKIERSRLNGDRDKRLAGNINMCFEGIEGEALLLTLDNNGVSASSGSACTSGSLDPSHVLLAIGLPHEIAHGSLRLSFSDYNTMEDVDYILEIMPSIVKRLRDMSPLWEQIVKRN